MQRVKQVMPADPWVATFAQTAPGDPSREAPMVYPLVGWALVDPDAIIRAGQKPGEQRLVGMIAKGRGVELVDEQDETFLGYQQPLSMRIRAQHEEDDAKAEDQRRGY